MKPIRVWNLNAGIEMKPIGVADLNIEVKMKPTGVGNPDVEVKMNEPDLLNPDTVVKMPDIARFYPNDEVKTVDNNVRMKPPEQILVERFYFVADVAVKRIEYVMNPNEKQLAAMNWLIVYN